MFEDTSAPTTLRDKKGCTWTVLPFERRMRHLLEDFYASFEPKRAAQGLPPSEAPAIRAWLTHVLERGTHFVVHNDDADIVAHMMVVPLPDTTNTMELATFVHQSIRNRGIGSALNALGVRVARERRCTHVWLSVEPSNKSAIRSYEKVGFRRLPGSLWAPEMEMSVALQDTILA